MKGAVFASARRFLKTSRPDLIGWVFLGKDSVDVLGATLDDFGYSVYALRGGDLMMLPTLRAAAALRYTAR